MAFCNNNNTSIYYEQHGEGKPVVLVHGGATSFRFNYGVFGWIEDLNESGFQVIGLDMRGHGQSDKPLLPEEYGTDKLASDVLAVMVELGVEVASIVGYSLGSAVALHLIQTSPERFSSASLVATGDGLLGYPPHTFSALLPVLAEAVSRSEFPDDLPEHVAAYWTFVTQSGGSREAISSAAKAEYPVLSIALAAEIQAPVLVVSGERDPVLGQGLRLAEALGQGEYLEIEKADHFNLAAKNSVKKAITAFFMKHNR